MSNSSFPLRAAKGDVWIRNAALLKHLYIYERNPLKQVRELMEGQHGFPSFPLSTYDTKLRKLGPMKKLKKTDLIAAYPHIRNRGGKETDYLNGIEIPLEKAWKEIQRSGAQVTSDGRPLELPPGVVVRSPSRTMHATPLSSPPISTPGVTDIVREVSAVSDHNSFVWMLSGRRQPIKSAHGFKRLKHKTISKDNTADENKRRSASLAYLGSRLTSCHNTSENVNPIRATLPSRSTPAL
ncbi:hypothetical protein F4679DRAFT_361635 [Xylaria curta]|nr:hypothetical protein F4679DRAFT_361635 [Xylaria curta]